LEPAEGTGGQDTVPNVPAGPILKQNIVFGLRQTTLQSLRAWPEAFRVRAVWKPKRLPSEEKETGEKKEKRWRLTESLGYGDRLSPANG
jgi:hypothetical protein